MQLDHGDLLRLGIPPFAGSISACRIDDPYRRPAGGEADHQQENESSGDDREAVRLTARQIWRRRGSDFGLTAAKARVNTHDRQPISENRY
jgi:hypothetical protein